jgi:hypothetical protein
VEELTLLDIAKLENKPPSYTAYLRKQIAKGLLKHKMIGEKVYVVRRKDYEAWKANKPERGQRRDYMKNKKTSTD